MQGFLCSGSFLCAGTVLTARHLVFVGYVFKFSHPMSFGLLNNTLRELLHSPCFRRGKGCDELCLQPSYVDVTIPHPLHYTNSSWPRPQLIYSAQCAPGSAEPGLASPVTAHLFPPAQPTSPFLSFHTQAQLAGTGTLMSSPKGTGLCFPEYLHSPLVSLSSLATTWKNVSHSPWCPSEDYGRPWVL